MKRIFIMALTITVCTSEAFAITRCSEVAPAAIAARANKDILRVIGSGNRISEQEVIIAKYDDPSDFVAVVGLGALGAFAYRVKTHYEDETICVVDSVKPTTITISKRISDVKL